MTIHLNNDLPLCWVSRFIYDYAEYHFAECLILNVIFLSFVMLNVIILSDIMLNVIILSFVILNDIILSFVMLNVIILSDIMLNVIILSVVILNAITLSFIMLNVIILSDILPNVVAPNKKNNLPVTSQRQKMTSSEVLRFYLVSISTFQFDMVSMMLNILLVWQNKLECLHWEDFTPNIIIYHWMSPHKAIYVGYFSLYMCVCVCVCMYKARVFVLWKF